jgi:hypothetical protein
VPDQFVLEKIDRSISDEPYEVIAVDAEGSVVVSQRDEESGELVVVSIDGDAVQGEELV